MRSCKESVGSDNTGLQSAHSMYLLGSFVHEYEATVGESKV